MRIRDAKDVVDRARQLQSIVERITPEEFHWQESHYDHDSRRGRELLFLIANHEWVRATSEIIEIERSDAIDTTLKIDIDLDQITHEAFRKKAGPLWMPITLLPPHYAQSGQLPLRDQRLEPDPFATVTDAIGQLLPMLPTADVRHQMSAAMAEIIVNMAISHWPDTSGQRPSASRDQCLLLSAAIYRLLRRGSIVQQSIANEASERTPENGASLGRIDSSRQQLLRMLKRYNNLLEEIAKQTPREGMGQDSSRTPQFAPELARRAVVVLNALAESVLIVVPIYPTSAPTALTVRVPTRTFNSSGGWKLLKPSTWMLRPLGHLEIDALMPTSDADRELQIHLPDGMAFEPSNPKAGKNAGYPRMDIHVSRPQPLEDLTSLMDQVLDQPQRQHSLASQECLADLAQSKMTAARETLRLYDVALGNDARRATSTARKTLEDLQIALTEFRNCAGEEGKGANEKLAGARSKLTAISKKFQEETTYLYRRVSVDRRGPRTLLARADMVEEVYQRANPTNAKICADVVVTDGEYFSIARFSGRMSLLLMTVVLAFLVSAQLLHYHGKTSPEVLAIVLTLFSAIQAGQMQSPDRSDLRGLLSAAGNWLIAASILPAVILAVALAFSDVGWVPIIIAAFSVGLQVLFQVAMLYGPLTATGLSRLEQSRKFFTVEPDYNLFESLRSDYWQSTTAEALMMGRPAYAYVAWQVEMPPPLKPILDWKSNIARNDDSADILALLHAGTYGQAVTFAVFREEVSEDWLPSASIVRKLDLNPDRLAPMEAITSVVDVFVGVPKDMRLTIAEHPLSGVLNAASRQLIVLEAQLPVPPPVKGYGARQWARIRIGLRNNGDIRQLTTFLDAIYEHIARRMVEHRHCIVAVQTVPTTDPRIIMGPVPGPDLGLRQLCASDLDIVQPTMVEGEDVDVQSWRVLTFCAEARSNIDSDIVNKVTEAAPRVRLAGMTYALMHGMAVAIMVIHDPGNNVNHHDSFETKLRDKASSAKLSVLINERLSREQLGAITHYPLLRVHFYWRDRPGALLNVLNSLSKTLKEEEPSINENRWSVSYARTQIAAGRAALARLTVRLHMSPHELDLWRPNFEDIERKIRARTRLEAEAGNANLPYDEQTAPEDPVISVSLMKTPINAEDESG